MKISITYEYGEYIVELETGETIVNEVLKAVRVSEDFVALDGASEDDWGVFEDRRGDFAAFAAGFLGGVNRPQFWGLHFRGECSAEGDEALDGTQERKALSLDDFLIIASTARKLLSLAPSSGI